MHGIRVRHGSRLLQATYSFQFYELSSKIFPVFLDLTSVFDSEEEKPKPSEKDKKVDSPLYLPTYCTYRRYRINVVILIVSPVVGTVGTVGTGTYDAHHYLMPVGTGRYLAVPT